MPIVFGEMVLSVDEIVRAFQRHGDAVRGTYRARYRFDQHTHDFYGGVQLERPESLRENPSDVVYPWEQIFISAAACAGSDYPMIAAHWNVAIESVDFVVEGVFDPRGQFDGLAGFTAPADARGCYASLHLRATIVSDARRESLERLHAHVVSRNMVLGALRGVPRTDELLLMRSGALAVSA